MLVGIFHTAQGTPPQPYPLGAMILLIRVPAWFRLNTRFQLKEKFMLQSKTIRWRVGGAVFLGLCFLAAMLVAQNKRPQDVTTETAVTELTQVLGRPTDTAITTNVLAPNDIEAYAEYGVQPGAYTGKTAVATSKAKTSFELVMSQLKTDTQYYYRLRYRQPGAAAFTNGTEYQFHTQRAPGSTFTFDVQADSHPERTGNMFHADLYNRTMAEVRKEHPDFYITLGDDFSIDQLSTQVTPVTVDQVYINQRHYLGMDGASTPVFLVAGGHEQGAKYLLDGTPNNAAVWVGNSRNRFYPLPEPNNFYTGDQEKVQFIGSLRDYYAWTWGDALFITIDPYWHSDMAVDTMLANGGKDNAGKSKRDGWDITHGEAQYRWLKQTLEQSKAKYKFMFAHHVLGTDRGAIEMADLFEWGGRSKSGTWEFDKKRPGWELPIHQLMVKYGVSIFFQGHDHIFVRQEKDGVVYQETPNPANPFYTEANGGWRSAYKSGDYLPASGHLRVTVSPANTKVEYIRSWMPKDESPEHKQGEMAYAYTVKPGK